MVDKLTRCVIHPFLTALYPVLFLLSINARELPLQEAGRALVVALVAALILTLLFGALFRDIQRGGLLASLVLALFFSYGHIDNWVRQNIPALENQTLLGVLWVILLLLGAWGVYKARHVGNSTKRLNVLMLFLLIQPVLSLSLSIYRYGAQKDDEVDISLDVIPKDAPLSQDFPDIYYIILDGYGRSDVLREIYGYDNSALMDYLKEKGFYVADQSHSNYVQTYLSLSSSLNYKYLDIKESELYSGDRTRIIRGIERSKAAKFLKEQGYQTVTFYTGYDKTTIKNSDIFITYKTEGFNRFEGLIFSTSLMSALSTEVRQQWFVDPYRCEDRRGYILNIFENLQKIPKLPGPQFVFAHVIAPHPPFVFDKDGNAVGSDCTSFNDASSFDGSKSEYAEGYSQQLEYINSLIQKTVDNILFQSPSAIIILQGDHGPGMLLDWSSIENSCLRERVSILNAYYIPNIEDGKLYSTISPVNSFRVLLNEVFGLQLNILDDRIYYSSWDHPPYSLTDVTTSVESACEIK